MEMWVILRICAHRQSGTKRTSEAGATERATRTQCGFRNGRHTYLVVLSPLSSHPTRVPSRPIYIIFLILKTGDQLSARVSDRTQRTRTPNAFNFVRCFSLYRLLLPFPLLRDTHINISFASFPTVLLQLTY